KIQSAIDVGADIQARIQDRWPHAGTGCDVKHRADLLLAEHSLHQVEVSNVTADNSKFSRNPREIALLGLRGVKIVEVIQHHHLDTGIKQSFAEVGANESGAARDKGFGERELHVDTERDGGDQWRSRRKGSCHPASKWPERAPRD